MRRILTLLVFRSSYACWCKCFGIVFIVAALCGNNLASATLLDGKQLRLTHEVDSGTVVGGPFDIVVGPGVDQTGLCCLADDAYGVDVSDTQILLDFHRVANGHFSDNATFNGLHVFDFTGTVPAFTTVTLNSTSFPASRIDATAVTFDADNIFVDFIRGGTTGDLFYSEDDFILLDVQTPVNQIGDTNADGLVNIDDLNNVRNFFGTSGAADGSLDGDAYPFDGMVNLNDLNLVRNNCCRMNEAAPVPEPSGFLLAVTGGVFLLRLRSPVRKRRGSTVAGN